ncbi:hypothetical protein BH10BAC3_BH10BAC3_11500 [soil metagenome]
MEDLLSRITSRPGLCGGKPTIRGMRIRVTDVLDLLSNGLSYAEVLQELEDLELEDIRACIMYASQKIDYPVLHGAA